MHAPISTIPPATGTVTTRRWIITGQVQGVGYRPFVYRIATGMGVCGWIRNQAGSVEIVGQGPAAILTKFAELLITDSPAIAEPCISDTETVPAIDSETFDIRESDSGVRPHIHVPVDYFICDDCLAELNDPNNRRFRYPFTNCTQCGPRYTLIHSLPYDRGNTSMADFPLCTTCRTEYNDPVDRRFHAEPVACPECGPQLAFVSKTARISDTADALEATRQALAEGLIVAVRGVGGYHLACDASNDDAISRLRKQKPRPRKPLAVLFPLSGSDGLDTVREYVLLRDEEEKLLKSPVRPVVLARKRPVARLSNHIAPRLDELGVMLPYSPLHYLLAKDFDGPLVVTSANISGEPVLTESADVEARLGHVADAFLHHDRPIVRPADDAVFRFNTNRMRLIRPGRGCAPIELSLPEALPCPVLAVGGHMKATIALGWEDRVVVSPHIGDMGTPRSLEVFIQVIEDLQTLYAVKAEAVVCDAHPGYTTNRWASESGLPVTRVFHHHAHASALTGEQLTNSSEPWIVFTWDGTGYGEDGTLWGGEVFIGYPGKWERKASLRSFSLPGGDQAGTEPWRSAAALCWEVDKQWTSPLEDTDIARHAWERRINCPLSSAAGRLFDAAASLTSVLHVASFEGQGPMYIEAISSSNGSALQLPVSTDDTGILRTDWEPLLDRLVDVHIPIEQRAADFHSTLAAAILEQAKAMRDKTGVSRVGLTGGVFQNRRLAEDACDRLKTAGFSVELPGRLSCNDAGISFGQIIEFLAMHKHSLIRDP